MTENSKKQNVNTRQMPAPILSRQSGTTPGTGPPTEAHPTILVADDNNDDTFFLAQAFMKAGASGTIHLVRDGQDAIDYLQGRHPYGNRAQFPFPNLFVVDANLPFVSGLEVLDWVRRQRFSQPLVVGVLSGTDHEPDMEKALALGAKFYFAKPHKFEDLVVIARQLADQCAAGLSASQTSG
jgi:CheY-like chemotaxis protein